MSGIYAAIGRRVDDYLATGAAPPEGAVRTECMRCGTPLIISASGEAKLKEAVATGIYRLIGAVCVDCFMTLRNVQALELSDHAAEVLQRDDRPGARRLLDEILEKIGRHSEVPPKQP